MSITDSDMSTLLQQPESRRTRRHEEMGPIKAASEAQCHASSVLFMIGSVILEAAQKHADAPGWWALHAVWLVPTACSIRGVEA